MKEIRKAKRDVTRLKKKLEKAEEEIGKGRQRDDALVCTTKALL